MKVKDLLTSAEKWTQGYNARDINRCRIDPKSLKACSWCLSGALMKCYGLEDGEVYKRVYDKIETLYIPSWNDNPYRQFEDVKSLIEEIDI